MMLKKYLCFCLLTKVFVRKKLEKYASSDYEWELQIGDSRNSTGFFFSFFFVYVRKGFVLHLSISFSASFWCVYTGINGIKTVESSARGLVNFEDWFRSKETENRLRFHDISWFQCTLSEFQNNLDKNFLLKLNL